MKLKSDKNFDDIADRFEQRIVERQQGKISQAIILRDLESNLPELFKSNNPHWRVLDLGGGLGKFTSIMASKGHHCVYNDVSLVMLQKAMNLSLNNKVMENVEWLHGPYQDIEKQFTGSFQLILCHEVIEWLADPESLIKSLSLMLKPNGYLSFCFFNPAGRVFKNLLQGNFKQLHQESKCLTEKRLPTPENPPDVSKIQSWLEKYGFSTVSSSGIRVFSDYAMAQRGELQSMEHVYEMEMKYSRIEPFRSMGRYLHHICQKTSMD